MEVEEEADGSDLQMQGTDAIFWSLFKPFINGGSTQTSGTTSGTTSSGTSGNSSGGPSFTSGNLNQSNQVQSGGDATQMVTQNWAAAAAPASSGNSTRR
jgi:hypothetical protein